MKDKENEQQVPRFKRCSVCGDIIGIMRKIAASRLDKKGNFELTQKQFCSKRCAIIGVKILAEVNLTKQTERENFIKMIDEKIKFIGERRKKALEEYGDINNIPALAMSRLYPGAVHILEEFKRNLTNEDEKEES